MSTEPTSREKWARWLDKLRTEAIALHLYRKVWRQFIKAAGSSVMPTDEQPSISEMVFVSTPRSGLEGHPAPTSRGPEHCSRLDPYGHLTHKQPIFGADK